MRKTMLFVAAACMLAVAPVSAENQKENDYVFESAVLVKKAEINSFCKAIIQGDFETVQKLITLGEDVNQKSLGMTPAIFAARYNKAKILKLLIANGADIKIRSDKGYSITKYAEAANAVEALAILNKAKRS